VRTVPLHAAGAAKDETGSATYQNLAITINRIVGNVKDGYKNAGNNYVISVSEEKLLILV